MDCKIQEEAVENYVSKGCKWEREWYTNWPFPVARVLNVELEKVVFDFVDRKKTLNHWKRLMSPLGERKEYRSHRDDHVKVQGLPFKFKSLRDQWGEKFNIVKKQYDRQRHLEEHLYLEAQALQAVTLDCEFVLSNCLPWSRHLFARQLLHEFARSLDYENKTRDYDTANQTMCSGVTHLNADFGWASPKVTNLVEFLVGYCTTEQLEEPDPETSKNILAVALFRCQLEMVEVLIRKGMSLSTPTLLNKNVFSCALESIAPHLVLERLSEICDDDTNVIALELQLQIYEQKMVFDQILDAEQKKNYWSPRQRRGEVKLKPKHIWDHFILPVKCILWLLVALLANMLATGILTILSLSSV